MDNKPHSTSRRGFFTGAAAVSAAAVGAAVLPQRQAETESASAQTGQKKKGYQLSEHVKRYYQTTQV